MQGIERIRYVTANYTNLQGLRWFIWGLLCLAVAAEDGGWLPTSVMILVAMPAGVILFLWSAAYYSQKFGHVIAPVKANIEMMRIAILAVTALTSFLVDRTLQPPIHIAPLILAAGLVIMHRQVGQPRLRPYLIVAILVAIADFALYWLNVPPDSAFGRQGVVLWTIIGLSLIVSGIFDHMMLVGTLEQVE